MDFSKASSLLHKTTGALLVMPPSFYRDRFRSGLITLEDLKKASNELYCSGQPKISSDSATITDLISALEGNCWEEAQRLLNFLPSALLDTSIETRWGAFISEDISKWCTAYFDLGQALWGFPWRGMPLFHAWKEAAMLDHTPEICGLNGWRKLVHQLADDPMEVIEDCALKLRIPVEQAADVFHGLLLSIGGWAGHIQFLAHEKQLRGDKETSLNDLLAIRIVYELALQGAFPEETSVKLASAESTSSAGNLTHLIWQRAHERALQRSLFDNLAYTSTNGRKLELESKSPLPSFQAVFCIDVRSEIYRRALEKVAPQVQTIGFAGFFGFPIEVVPAGETNGSPQCPVLLTPGARVCERTSPKTLQVIGFRKRVKSAWKSFKSSAVSSFIFVELAGLGFLPRILRDLLHLPRKSLNPTCCHPLDVDSITMETKIALAAGALRHLGLSKGKLARIVLICGHGSSTENNPFGSSLDCGACGGHSGEANARTAAAILNNPAVRLGLAEKGILIPAETWFLAGLHNTTTDKVTLFDKECSPTSHLNEIDLLAGYLVQAGVIARQERAPLLGLDPTDPCLEKLITARSHDWSQVRPEWGLAGNYAFIAASRELTRGVDLGGRVFLNDYSHEKDEDEATLELILSAPVVVASWINLQYFASTVDNKRFGSGDKTIHNVAGMLGVFEGNGGDIRPGLPLQSVHDGKEWRHEPVRLHVCVEAPKESIDRILKTHPSVAELVSNQWIHLFAMRRTSEFTLIFEKSNGLGGWVYEPIYKEFQSID
jgi:hypothetical protein